MFSILIKKIKTVFGFGKSKVIPSIPNKAATANDKEYIPDSKQLSDNDPVNAINWDVVDRLVDENFKSWVSRREEDREEERATERTQASEGSTQRDKDRKVNRITGEDAINLKLDRLRGYVRDKERMVK